MTQFKDFNYKFRHVSYVSYGGKIISYGENHVSGNKSIHAEIAAINYLLKNCFKQRKFSRLKLVVYRIKSDGTYGNSKPCQNCIQTLKMYGLKSVLYSNESGNFVCEKIRHIQNNHRTWYYRNFQLN